MHNATHWDIYRYALPIKAPLKLSSTQTISKREGILIASSHAHSPVAFAEIAPLPSYSNESLEMALDQLMRFVRTKATQAFLTSSWSQWVALLEGFEHGMFPSVRFALEALYLQRQRLEQSPRTPFVAHPQQTQQHTPQQKRHVPLLRSLLLDSLPSKAQAFRNNPHIKEIKVKIKSKEDLPRLLLLISLLRKDQTLRLDGRASFSFEDASEIVHGLRHSSISYFEEPLMLEYPLSKLEKLYDQSGIGYALDERLRLDEFSVPWDYEGLKALVCKPMLHGSIQNIQTLSQKAYEHGKRFVISASYESPIGLQFLNHLGMMLSLEDDPGLDTLGVFSQSIWGAEHPQILAFWESQGYLKFCDRVVLD